MRFFSKLTKHRLFWVTGLVCVSLIIWNIWNIASAPYRMDQHLLDEVRNSNGHFDIVVEVDFKLERYHIDYFQKLRGRVARIENNRVFLRSVPASVVRAIARKYWVSQLRSVSDDILE